MLEKNDLLKSDSVSPAYLDTTLPALLWYQTQSDLPDCVLSLSSLYYDGDQLYCQYDTRGATALKPAIAPSYSDMMPAIQPGLDWFAASGYPITALAPDDIYVCDGQFYIAPRFLPVIENSLTPPRIATPHYWRWLIGTSLISLSLLIGFLAIYMWPAQYDTVRVPNVIGLPLPEALTKLQTIQTYTIHQQYNATVPAGAVIGTVPPAGRVIRPTRSLYINVSNGAPTITIPDFIGKSLVQARVLASASDLLLTHAPGDYSLSVPTGIIYDQTPEPGHNTTDSGVHVLPSLGPPVTLAITNNDALSVFMNQPMLSVSITGHIPETWVDKTVSIYVSSRESKPVYTATHAPGESFSLTTPVANKTWIWVQFNTETVIERLVQAEPAT